MGHATRCTPIIRQFIDKGHEVIIGADKFPLAFLKLEFPQLKTVVVPGYEVTYNKKGSSFKLFYESVQFFNFIKKEHALIDKIVEENNIDMIVSDNRYGLWNKKIKSIIITHQLYVKAPFGEKIAHQKIEKLIGNFDECWIPDVEGELNLSGDLSHLKPFNHPHKFIGPLSRFSTKITANLSVFKDRKNISKSLETYQFDIIAILSGPEPQRAIFENLVLEQIEKYNLKAVVVRGLPSDKEPEVGSEETEIFNHLSTKKLFQYIKKSKVVVCRAGYSSIMDLATLGKKAILVPTPGQTEQEYLAKHHLDLGNFYSQKQSEFDLEKGLIEVGKM